MTIHYHNNTGIKPCEHPEIGWATHHTQIVPFYSYTATEIIKITKALNGERDKND